MLASLAVVPVGGYKYIQGEEHDACCEAITTTTPGFFGKQEQVLSTNQQKTEAKANERREQAEAFADAIQRRETGTTAPSKSK